MIFTKKYKKIYNLQKSIKKYIKNIKRSLKTLIS